MRYLAERAWLPDGLADDVLLEVDAGRFTEVRALSAGEAKPPDAHRLRGVTLPGLANAHSHAFHRALRGRTHRGAGTFWTWRESMYDLSARLDPDNYFHLARGLYAEMVLAGITCVGEFHYLHHAPDGRPYAEPNAMGEALQAAAHEAGIRLTLLDTAYLAGGLAPDGHTGPGPRQRRFADRDIDAWADRVAALRDSDAVRVGAAIHSVRAVPREHLAAVAAVAHAGLGGRTGPAPLHVHVSEQREENEICLAYYGQTPTQILAEAGIWDGDATAVHATHVSDDDVATLGGAGSAVCLCPTTERDLADGIGPARALADAGARLTLGSDQHVVIDIFDEMRALEGHERLTSLRRGRFTPAESICAMTAHDSLGWEDAGRLEPGARADLVVLRDDTVRTAGASSEQLIMAATAADVSTVIIDGVEVVTDGHHRLSEVGALLSETINALWADA